MHSFENIKRKSFGQHFPKDVIRQLRTDHEGSYSITEAGLAEETSLSILRLFGPEKAPYVTITDCTSGVGGNTINFIKHFSRVNSIEMDPTRSAHAQHNVNVIFGGSPSNVKFFIGDGSQIPLTLRQDVLFLDPPWGGPEYDQVPLLELYLGGRRLSNVCNSFKGHASLLVLKVPFNFNIAGFSEDCQGSWTHMRMKKMGWNKWKQRPYFLLLAFFAVRDP
jgi:hypothetical protein